MVISSPTTQAQVLRLAQSTLQRILTFKTVVDIQRYMARRHARDFRDFEMEAAESEGDDRFQGAGVLAVRADLATPRSSGEQGFYHDNVPLGAHELGAYIDAFPLEAASASYVFTLLEVYGDKVAGLVRPGSINRNKAWHENIKGFADLRDAVQVRKAREAFGEHFGAEADDVPEPAARRMVDLKAARNAFAHDGELRMGFGTYVKDTLAVVCHIAFLTTEETRISVYPWEDHWDRFTPLSKF